MANYLLENKSHLEELALESEHADLPAKYMAACNLHSLARKYPRHIRLQTVATLEKVLNDPAVSCQRQSLFVFREAALALAAVFRAAEDQTLADDAINALFRILKTNSAMSHRAVTEALGTLPFPIPIPHLIEEKIQAIPAVRWEELLAANNLSVCGGCRFAGRSFMVPLANTDRIFVIKLAIPADTPEGLRREAKWMDHLRQQEYAFPLRFDVPEAIRMEGEFLFRLYSLPLEPPESIKRHPDKFAIGFMAHQDYFSYPNESNGKGLLPPRDFMEVMRRNAWLFGRLSSLGIIHTAPIPLFHNRVQRSRREDHGVYDWPRGGRLDRWLDSCRHPNIGITGVRDFEHFEVFHGTSSKMYWYVGSHFFSLLLIAGSYFRNRDISRIGFDESGMPVDSRDLYDADVLQAVIKDIFLGYYSGFVGQEYRGQMPLSLERLSARMIAEMGVDHHMEEILRVVDQLAMSDEEYREFLLLRGYSSQKIADRPRGVKDIVVYTGPHLGKFNYPISIPELVSAAGSMAATCIVGRYRRTQMQ